MPHASLKLIPGVDQNKTPALNEAAISYSNLIRFIPDRDGLGLVQKLGGWTKFYPNQINSPVRALHAWQTLNDRDYLGIGAEDSLSVLNDGSLRDVTPELLTVNAPVNVSTVDGSNVVTITDIDSNVDGYDSVFIQTQITIGGLRIQGLYACRAISSGTYSIEAVNVLGDPDNATSDDSGGFTPSFTTTPGSSFIDVNLPDHKYSIGNTATFLVPTVVGGITIYGDYTVVDVGNADNFIISGDVTATSPAQTKKMNNGLARYVYFNGIGPIAAGTGYGVEDYGEGGYGTGVTPSAFRVCGTIGTKGDGTTATISHSTNTAIPVGTTVSIAGVTPDYNGTFLVLDSTSNVFNVTGASGDGTTVTIVHDGNVAIEVGTVISVTGCNPSAYNGNYTVTYSSSSVVQYLAATTAAYVSGGIIASNTIDIANATTGAQTVAGTISLLDLPGILDTSDWTLDNWGENLIACPVHGGIYQWISSSGDPVATIISEAPTVNDGMFVAMPQRQIIAWGSSFTGIQDPLLIRWCDVQNYNDWIASPTNLAGSYRIPKGSRIVGCIQGPQQGLIWTDLAIWAMQYTGYPNVYAFNEIGNGCGLISRKAASSMSGVVYWMSQSQFFRLAGGGPEPIPCPVWDVIFQDLDTNNLDKIRVAPNSRFGEISWYYPTIGNGGEVSHYVKYNIYLNSWDFGTLSRTAWINQSVLGPPIGAGDDRYIYQHETSTDADGLPLNASFQTGYFQLQDGDLLTFIDQWWPDAKWGYYGGTQNANLLLTFYVTQYAGDTAPGPNSTFQEFGPFNLTQATQYVSPRLRGRLVSMKIESNDIGTFWRLGNMRYRWQPDGKY